MNATEAKQARQGRLCIVGVAKGADELVHLPLLHAVGRRRRRGATERFELGVHHLIQLAPTPVGRTPLPSWLERGARRRACRLLLGQRTCKK